MTAGPRVGLNLLERLDTDVSVTRSRRLHAVRAHLLEQEGDVVGALASYETAAGYATNTRQQCYLNAQIARLRTPA
jgi:predicted RNA polymerase sigma factor